MLDVVLALPAQAVEGYCVEAKVETLTLFGDQHQQVWPGAGRRRHAGPATRRELEAVNDTSGILAPALPSWSRRPQLRCHRGRCALYRIAPLSPDAWRQIGRYRSGTDSLRGAIDLGLSPACTLAMPRQGTAFQKGPVTLTVGSRVAGF